MSFVGFSRDLESFLDDLQANNNREWFEANRDRYNAAFLDPAKAFVEAIAGQLDSLMPGLVAEPKINGSIRRLNRDTRFSKDKRPYHDHLHLIFWRGAKANTSPGFHLVLRSGGGGIGAGQWGLSDSELAAYRDAVMTKAGAETLRQAIAEAETMPGQQLDEAALKRVPKGGRGCTRSRPAALQGHRRERRHARRRAAVQAGLRRPCHALLPDDEAARKLAG